MQFNAVDGAALHRVLELLSFRGRLSRLAYWRAYLVLSVAAVATALIGLLAAIYLHPVLGILLLPILPIVLANIAITVRRLHDRGKSGWWLLPFVLFPPLVLDFAREFQLHSPLILLAIILAAVTLSVWGFVEIGFRRGVPRPNRYDLPDVASQASARPSQ